MMAASICQCLASCETSYIVGRHSILSLCCIARRADCIRISYCCSISFHHLRIRKGITVVMPMHILYSLWTLSQALPLSACLCPASLSLTDSRDYLRLSAGITSEENEAATPPYASGILQIAIWWAPIRLARMLNAAMRRP